MKRRAAIIAAALTVAVGLGSASAQASETDVATVRTAGGETNGCVVVKPLLVAVCIPRL